MNSVDTPHSFVPLGTLAMRHGALLPLRVCRSAAGFYIGTLEMDETIGSELPFTRESVEYFPTQAAAELALSTDTFTQRRNI